VLDVTPSATRPDRGTVRIRGELTNQDGVTVLRMTSRGHFGRRAAAE
jgi:acyl dehydratase